GFTRRIQAHARRRAGILQTLHQLQCGLACLGRVIRAALPPQESAAWRQQVEMRRSLAAESIDDASFKAFEADRSEFQDFRNMIRSLETVTVPKTNHPPGPR